MPDLVSSSTSFVSIELRTSAGMMLAWSTIRPVSAGHVSAKAASAANISATNSAVAHAPPAIWRGEAWPAVMFGLRARRGSELHGRWRLRSIARGELGHRLAAAEDGRGPQDAREGAQLGV